MERGRKFNILRGIVSGAFLRMEAKEELIDFINELEEVEKEIRNKAIDEFVSRLKKHEQENCVDHQEYGITWSDIELIAEQMKGE